MDNAGSFDVIAPQLLKNSSILAIGKLLLIILLSINKIKYIFKIIFNLKFNILDLPGHGLSSWLPPGIPYYQDIMAESMRLVVKNFGWNKVKLLGHSMGGILCFNYARLYPDEVEFVVQIDSLAPFTHRIPKHSRERASAIDKFIVFEKKTTANPPSYPEEIAMQKWIDSTVFKSLDVPSNNIFFI